MCVIDLDPDPDITEDEQMPGQAPVISQHPGVAWGRAGRHDQEPAPAAAGAGTR